MRVHSIQCAAALEGGAPCTPSEAYPRVRSRVALYEPCGHLISILSPCFSLCGVAAASDSAMIALLRGRVWDDKRGSIPII